MIIKTVKFICLTITAIAVSFVFAGSALAQSLNEIYVEIWDETESKWKDLCEDEECKESLPLFDEANFLPNDVVNRRVRITNQEIASGQGEQQKIAVEASDYMNIAYPYNLANVLFIVISEEGMPDDLYGGSKGAETLIDFYEAGEIDLSIIDNEASSIYNFAITFNPDADNEEWNKKDGDTKIKYTEFNVIFGLKGEETTEVIPGTPGTVAGAATELPEETILGSILGAATTKTGASILFIFLISLILAFLVYLNSKKVEKNSKKI